MNIGKLIKKFTLIDASKFTRRLRSPLSFLIWGAVCFVGGMYFLEGKQHSELNSSANNTIALSSDAKINNENKPDDVLSVSDPLLLTKITTLCPQIPPELLEMVMMFIETPEQRAAAAKLNNYEKPSRSTGPDWIKQAKSPFRKPTDDE